MPGPRFDPAALQHHRLRADRRPGRFFADQLVAEVVERLSVRRERPDRLLVLGHGPVDALAKLAPAVSFAPSLEKIDLPASPEFDAILCLGVLDTLDELPPVLAALRSLLAPAGSLFAAFPGNDTLPRLREALLTADRALGGAARPHVHPRLSPASMAGLLQDLGFRDPVVDVDRLNIRYRSLDGLVADLRDAGATNSLLERPRHSLRRSFLAQARQAFAALGDERGTVETVEIIHLAAHVD